MAIAALIVDDQADVRTLIRLFIKTANCGLVVAGEAADVKEALAQLDSLNPDVVVLDEMMPGISGIEAAALILKRRPGQALVLCSAHLDDNLRRRAEAAGIRACLSKDRIDELPAVVMAVVGS
jgi:DNA-binding NarL/FixJ family response regulator